MTSTTKLPSRSEQRRRSRERARLRHERLHLESTKVSQGVSKALTGMKVSITFDDLDDDQLRAYYGIHQWWRVQKDIGGVAEPLIIAGYAGCGKSALLSVALPALRNPDGSDVRVKYAAYTGKASNVLMSKDLPAQTLHSLIYECIPVGDSEFIFKLLDREDVQAELIVIDEASMVPDDMKRDLESLGIPVLYTGDHGQLPPVKGVGNVMDNPTYRLEKPHRQALESGIIEISTAVRNRQRIFLGTYGVRGDCEVVRAGTVEDVGLLASADIVICYTNDRRESLNRQLRKYKGFSGTYPNVGEKIICVKNNKLTRMFNGLILVVKAVKVVGGKITMDLIDEVGKEYLDICAFSNYFEGKPHPELRGKSKLDVFEFAYAITGHKSQGSQWDHVVVIEEVMFNQSMDIKRRWKYTVLTRAIEKLTYISMIK